MTDLCKIKLVMTAIAFASAAMLIGGVWPWPDFYYGVMRVVVCIGAVAMACFTWANSEMILEESRKKIWYYIMRIFTAIFVVVAFLFSPAWAIINCILAIGLAQFAWTRVSPLDVGGTIWFYLIAVFSTVLAVAVVLLSVFAWLRPIQLSHDITLIVNLATAALFLVAWLPLMLLYGSD